MTQVFLSTTGTQSTVQIDDLGQVVFTHPTSNLPLIEPDGEFQEEDISVSFDLEAEILAGTIVLTDSFGNTLNNIGDIQDASTVVLATEDNAGITEIATAAEISAGTDDFRIVTPLKLANAISGITEVNDLTASVTWAVVPDAFISQSSVTQHQAAINHDSLSGFVANEHIDWTQAGAGTINSTNINFPPEVNNLTSAVTWAVVPNAFISHD